MGERREREREKDSRRGEERKVDLVCCLLALDCQSDLLWIVDLNFSFR